MANHQPMDAAAFEALRERARVANAGEPVSHRDVFRHMRSDETARVVRLFAMRALPRDVRERVENIVERLEWVEFREATKALVQTRKERRRDVLRELTRLGCEPRADSKLCAGFVRGDLPGERLWTAKQVARRMAEMKYIHEYCEEFRDEVDDMREKFENLCEEYLGDDDFDDDEYDEYDDDDYYARLDRADAREAACEDSTGYRHFGRYVHDVAESWADFPARWPWLSEHDDAEIELTSGSDTPSSFESADSSEESDDDDDDDEAAADDVDDDDFDYFAEEQAEDDLIDRLYVEEYGRMRLPWYADSD